MAKKRSVARRRYSFARRGFRRARKMTLPVAVVAGFMPAVVGVWNRRNSVTEIGNYLQSGFTGVSNGQFNFANLRQGLIPVAAGFIAHMVAGRLGINRAIAQARIPLIRI